MIKSMWLYIKQRFASARQRPFLHVEMRMNKDFRIMTNVRFNPYAIAVIDSDYQQAGVDYYSPALPDNGKVAIYLSDTLNTVAAHYLPDEVKTGLKDISEEYEAANQASDEFDKQVVDLGMQVERG